MRKSRRWFRPSGGFFVPTGSRWSAFQLERPRLSPPSPGPPRLSAGALGAGTA